MTFEELWNTYVLPVIRYLIGPIVVGVVVYYLTNRATIKKDKEQTIRQLNVHYSKIKRIIELVEEVNKELEIIEDCDIKIGQMQKGDFSNVKDELEMVKSEQDCLQMFINNKNASTRKASKLSKDIKTISLELNDTPSDLLPTHIHAEIMELIESKRVELDLVKHKRLLKNIKKAM